MNNTAQDSTNYFLFQPHFYLFIYLSFTGNSVVRHGRDAYATTFGKKNNIQRLHTQINVFNST